MGRGHLILVIGVFVVAFILFFFFIPVISMDIYPCLIGGEGYASLSYYIFHAGETMINGHLSWLSRNYAGCF